MNAHTVNLLWLLYLSASGKTYQEIEDEDQGNDGEADLESMYHVSSAAPTEKPGISYMVNKLYARQQRTSGAVIPPREEHGVQH